MVYTIGCKDIENIKPEFVTKDSITLEFPWITLWKRISALSKVHGYFQSLFYPGAL